MVDGIIHNFSRFEDIPDRIDHVIKFLPEYPPPPHTHQQHLEIEQWTPLLAELIKREKNAWCS
jgi:hypothetical protein